jgi:hypothetical protein
MIEPSYEKYKNGIEATKKFIEEGKSKGIKILYDAPEFFLHNIDMWVCWLNKCGVDNVIVTPNRTDIHEGDLCILIAHLFQTGCNTKNYIAVQTESLVTKKLRWGCLTDAVAVWDYSIANCDYLIDQQKLTNVVCLPVMCYNNTAFYKKLKTDVTKDIDIIMPVNTTRRSELLIKFTNANIKCLSVWRSNMAGNVCRAKIFLNLHAHTTFSALEIHRLFEVRNIPIVIVSEKSDDVEFEKQLDKIIYANYDQLFDVCSIICKDPNLWQSCLEQQKEMWSKFPDDKIDNFLSSALGTKN